MHGGVSTSRSRAEMSRCAGRIAAPRARGNSRLEGSAGLVGAGANADRDEGHPVRAGERTAGGLGIEADEAPGPDGNLGAVDPPVSAAANDQRDLLLARAGLVVLAALRVGRQVEPVDAE